MTEINNAFVAGMHRGVLFAAAATLLGVFIVLRYLPARGTEVDGIPAATSPEEIEPEAIEAQATGPETNGNGLGAVGGNGTRPTPPALVPDP